jgi:hypothetical protein
MAGDDPARPPIVRFELCTAALLFTSLDPRLHEQTHIFNLTLMWSLILFEDHEPRRTETGKAHHGPSSCQAGVRIQMTPLEDGFPPAVKHQNTPCTPKSLLDSKGRPSGVVVVTCCMLYSIHGPSEAGCWLPAQWPLARAESRSQQTVCLTCI